MVSSLNVAKLSIGMEKDVFVPPNVTLTFCVDTSGSMGDTNRSVEDKREKAVKEGVNLVFDSAQKVVETINGAQIKIGIIGFNGSVRTICKPTLINQRNIAKLREKLNKYNSMVLQVSSPV